MATLPKAENRPLHHQEKTHCISRTKNASQKIKFYEKTAITILKIVETYGTQFQKTGMPWKGLNSFIPMVSEQVKRQEAIRMILPAFPFKSPNNQDKVLGRFPDLGEELALGYLNGMCENIKGAYGPGADVWICSDGLVYNDILGVPDETVWEYGEALRKMAFEKHFHHIKFIRLYELLNYPWLSQSDSNSNLKSFYLSQAPHLRKELTIHFGDPDFDAHLAIKTDHDTCLTYRGYIKFLTKDLAHHHRSDIKCGSLSKRAKAKFIGQIARQMIVRGNMFAAAIRANRGDYVRLSIHDSGGERKLPISLVPGSSSNTRSDGYENPVYTPWHSCIAVDRYGESHRTVHVEDVRDTHDMIYKGDRPYYFRER